MPDAPSFRPLVINGVVWGTIYTFAEAGDELAVHVHETEESNHITMVLFGSIKVIGDKSFDGTVIEAKAGGTIVKWPLGKPHGFVALTDGATIANLATARPCPASR